MLPGYGDFCFYVLVKGLKAEIFCICAVAVFLFEFSGCGFFCVIKMLYDSKSCVHFQAKYL